MKQAFLCALLLSATAPLAACDPEVPPQRLADKQIVCSLKGEAFIFVEGYEKSVHSSRSTESDPLCQPLKARITSEELHTKEGK